MVALARRPVYDAQRAQQPILARPIHEQLLFKRIVVPGRQDRVAGRLVIGGGQHHQMKAPFGRPGRMLQEVVKGAAAHRRVGVAGQVREVIEKGIRLVGLALAVAVDVDPESRGRLHGVLAERPDRVER